MKTTRAQAVQSEFSDFGFEVQDSFNFKIPFCAGFIDFLRTYNRDTGSTSMITPVTPIFFSSTYFCSRASR
jgi:hypothetical protein